MVMIWLDWNSHLYMCKKFGKFSPSFVGSYEIFSVSGKVTSELDLLTSGSIRFSISLGYQSVGDPKFINTLRRVGELIVILLLKNAGRDLRPKS